MRSQIVLSVLPSIIRRSTLILIVFAIQVSVVFSQIPSGYYDNAANKQGAVLKTALYNIIKGHTIIGYDNLSDAFPFTDKRADGKVWDMYSSCSFTFSNACGTYTNECDCYNKEHSMPASWFNDGSPMYSDLFHIYPTDGKVNGMRSNYPFGEVTSPTYTSTNGSKLGNCTYPGYNGEVFEPIDQYKGDFARSYFYLATRYDNVIANWENYSPQGDIVLSGNAYPAFESWTLSLLMSWHYADPVSQKEIDRNNVIYNSYQHNRNPFIDHPEYAALIWPEYAPYATEPANHAADFSAHCITLNWTDATGTVVPAGYLVRMSSVGFADIDEPADGNAVENGFFNKNVAYGTQKCIFGGLNPNTVYYFKIFGYSGSGTNIDYKTDGTIQQVSIQAK